MQIYSEEELRRGLTTKVFGCKLFVYDSIDSTNDQAKVLAIKGAEEGTVVIADHQTAGRGRLGRAWFAESGSSLLFSVIIRPTFATDKIGLLPFFAAVSVALAIEKVIGIKCECKWPNDILLNGNKCCGILMESAFQQNKLDYVIIGIGLNINQKYFIGDLESKATSLSNEYGTQLDRINVFCHIMLSLELLYKDIINSNFNTVLKEWKARTSMFGKRITLTQAGDVIEGTAINLSADGGIIVETGIGQNVYYAGDVTIIK